MLSKSKTTAKGKGSSTLKATRVLRDWMEETCNTGHPDTNPKVTRKPLASIRKEFGEMQDNGDADRMGYKPKR